MRGVLYVLVGISPLIPLFHMTYFVDPAHYIKPCMEEWALGGILYIFGAFLYGTRFPEKLVPGKFDYVGQSH